MVILAPGQSSRLSQVRLARAEVGLSPPSTDSSPGYDGAMRVNLGQALSKRPGGGANRGAENKNTRTAKDT